MSDKYVIMRDIYTQIYIDANLYRRKSIYFCNSFVSRDNELVNFVTMRLNNSIPPNIRLVEHTRADGSHTKKVKPYVMDLESTNGSFLNNVKIEARR